MRLTVKIGSIVLIAYMLMISGCSGQQPTLSQQQLNTISQHTNDLLKFEERIKKLESQVKSLNEEVYQNSERTKALEEVYDYVAQDNDLPSTGEESPVNVLP